MLCPVGRVSNQDHLIFYRQAGRSPLAGTEASLARRGHESVDHPWAAVKENHPVAGIMFS
jgi:hypothetical protein